MILFLQNANPCWPVAGRRSPVIGGRWLMVWGFWLLAGCLFLPSATGHWVPATGHRPPATDHPSADNLQANFAKLKLGMTVAEVRQLLGQPDQISRQYFYRRYLEQWSYSQPPCWLVFSYVRGQEPVLQIIQKKINE